MLPLLLVACSSEPVPEAPPAPAGPDIVLVVIDTLRAQHTSLHGYERPTTPHLEALAARGTWCSHAYAQSPWTLASFVSMFTGLDPHVHRVGRDDLDATRFGRLSASTPTLAGTLHEAGYATAAFLNNTFLAPEFGLQSGFDTYDYQGSTNFSHRSAPDTVDAGVAWLSEQDGPAFMVLHFMEPHLDYSPPDDIKGTFAKGPRPAQLDVKDQDPFTLLQMGVIQPTDETREYVKALYDEEVLAADRGVGRLVEALAPRWDRTALLVTADHGEEFWEHGGFEHGHSVYEEVVRVPLIISGGPIRQGVVDAPVQLVDLYPTCLEMLRVPAPSGAGVSLFTPLVSGAEVEPRTVFVSNTLYGNDRLALVEGKQKWIENSRKPKEHNFSLPGPEPKDTEEFYDLASDPGEQKNLRATLGETTVGRFRTALSRLRAPTGKKLPGKQVPMSDELRQKLESLGYVQ